MASTSTAAPKVPLRHPVGTAVTPGERLGPAARGGKSTTLLPGGGCYVRHGHLHASLAGTVGATRHDDDSADTDGGETWIVSVKSERPTAASVVSPEAGSLVLGRINRVARPTHATVDLVALVPESDGGSTQQPQPPPIIPFPEPFSGTLRQNELRPNSSLEIKIEECVRPGDVILARVHANGERDFILTTAEAELGVVRAICESSGCEMRPVSWKEMKCPVSGAREGRKVAKPRRVVGAN